MITSIFQKLFKNNQIASRKNEYCTIGKNTVINQGYLLNGFKDSKILIGSYCDIAENFRVRPRNHATSFANIQRKFQKENNLKETSVYKGDVTIGHTCWIGDNVIILPGVTIGNGVVIGAGSVVTKDLPSFSVAVGNPTKVIKYRFKDDMIDFLENLQWWFWDDKKIKKNKSFFEADLTLISVEELRNIII